MYYILKINNKAFVSVQENNELVITPDYEKANQYPTIGAAMKAAAAVNGALGSHIVKTESIGLV